MCPRVAYPDDCEDSRPVSPSKRQKVYNINDDDYYRQFLPGLQSEITDSPSISTQRNSVTGTSNFGAANFGCGRTDCSCLESGVRKDYSPSHNSDSDSDEPSDVITDNRLSNEVCANGPETDTYLRDFKLDLVSSGCKSESDIVLNRLLDFRLDSLRDFDFNFGNHPIDANSNFTSDKHPESLHIDDHFNMASTCRESKQQTLEKNRRLLLSPQDNCRNTELHLRILKRDVTGALDIIKKASDFDDLNVTNKLGQTPMHLAVQTGQGKILRKLICAGGLVDVLDNSENTPLHLACEMGRMDLVEHLLRPIRYEETIDNEYSIPVQAIPQDLTIKNGDGLTCLDLADDNNHIDVFNLLVDYMY